MENCALEQYTTLVLWHLHLRLVFGCGWGGLYGQFLRESERISYFRQFFERGHCHRMVASWARVVVIHDIARFNALSRMLRSLFFFFLAFCSPGSSQPLLSVCVCVCVVLEEQEESFTFHNLVM